MIQSGLSSSVLAIIIVVLILLSVKEFVESMNDKQDASNQRHKNEEKIEELKEKIQEAKAERQSNYRDMLTWQNVTISFIGVLVIVAIVLFVIAYRSSTSNSRLEAAKQAARNVVVTYPKEYLIQPARDMVLNPVLDKIRQMRNKQPVQRNDKKGGSVKDINNPQVVDPHVDKGRVQVSVGLQVPVGHQDPN